MNKVIALVGMTGCGKSTVSELLKEKGCGYVRFGQITMDIIKEKGLEVNEKNERIIREQLRKEHGMDAYAKLNVKKLEDALEKGNVIADGLYSWEEYVFLKDHFRERIAVAAVYASPETRYKRLAEREERPLTKGESGSRDRSEIENLNKGGPISMADYTVVNEGNMDELHNAVEKLLGEIND